MYDVGTDVKNAGKSKKMLKIVDRILKKNIHIMLIQYEHK